MKVKNGTQQADLGLKQNVRRAEGQAVNAAAGALEVAKSFVDSILFWNKVTIEVFSNAATTGEQPGPALGSRALSIVHLAMYDAYPGALGNPASLPKYLPQLEPAPLAAKASPKATVAGAAYESLLRLYPGQKALLDAQMLSFCDGAKGPLGLVALQPSLVCGAYIANSLLLQRAGDPIDNIAVPYASYTPPAGVNVWHWYEPDPVTPNRPLYAPSYGSTNPLFASTQRFTIDPVVSIGSAEVNAGYPYISTFGIASFLNETSLFFWGSSRSMVDAKGLEEEEKLIFFLSPFKLFQQALRVVLPKERVPFGPRPRERRGIEERGRDGLEARPRRRPWRALRPRPWRVAPQLRRIWGCNWQRRSCRRK